MIKQIHIKNVATFEDETITNLEKVNFIYGANGSGKTTIANVVQALEEYPDCDISWEGDKPLSVLVYNKKFKERNFGQGSIPGIFTLGEVSKEQELLKERYKDELSQLDEELDNKRKVIETETGNLEDLEKTFWEFCWTKIKKRHEKFFPVTFQGLSNNKRKFAEKVLSEFNQTKEFLDNSEGLLGDLKGRYQTLYATNLETLELIPNLEKVDSLADIEENGIWEKRILGKTDIEISSLINQLNISDWVNQGRQYIQEGSDICPFCQKKTIDEKFRQQIEEFFDESFVRDTEIVRNLTSRYLLISQTVMGELAKIIEKEKKHSSKLNISMVETLGNSLNQTILKNQELIRSKNNEPSRNVSLTTTKSLFDSISALIKQANSEIADYNVLVNNDEQEKIRLKADIWKYLVAENREAISDYKQLQASRTGKLTQSKAELRTSLARHKELEDEIAKCNKAVTGVEESIDYINNTLSSYGFTNFKIVPAEGNYYQICRANGDKAENTLSEGEQNFITFLYFLQLVRGGDSPETVEVEKVVVIDDPVSSLDNTMLPVVGYLINAKSKAVIEERSNVKQLIVLTHNVYFYHNISYGVRLSEASFWVVRKKKGQSHLEYYAKNPIRGSYASLWDEYKKEDLPSVAIQNIMRKIYEEYFKKLGQYNDDEIGDKFSTEQEKERFFALKSWLDDGSHNVYDDLNVMHDEDMVNTYRRTFKDIFLKTGHIEHYNMMMRKGNQTKD